MTCDHLDHFFTYLARGLFGYYSDDLAYLFFNHANILFIKSGFKVTVMF